MTSVWRMEGLWLHATQNRTTNCKLFGTNERGLLWQAPFHKDLGYLRWWLASLRRSSLQVVLVCAVLVATHNLLKICSTSNSCTFHGIQKSAQKTTSENNKIIYHSTGDISPPLEYWIASCWKHSLKLTASLPLKIRPKQPKGKEMQFIFQSSIFQRLSTSIREGILHHNPLTNAIVCALSPLQSPKPHQRTLPKPPAHPDTQINEGIRYQGLNTTPGQLVSQTGERCRVGTVEPTKPFVLNWEYI